MPINNVSGNYAYQGYSSINEQQKVEKKDEADDSKAKALEKPAKKVDSIEISSKENKPVERPGADKVAEARNDVTRNTSAFRAMAEALFRAQGDNYTGKLKDDLQKIIGDVKIDNADTSFDNDPEWGVDAVANRILDFAKSLANGDESKIEMLREAVKKGFQEAEKAWGGELPGISQRTYDKIMKGFDEWKNPETTVAD